MMPSIFPIKMLLICLTTTTSITHSKLQSPKKASKLKHPTKHQNSIVRASSQTNPDPKPKARLPNMAPSTQPLQELLADDLIDRHKHIQDISARVDHLRVAAIATCSHSHANAHADAIAKLNNIELLRQQAMTDFNDALKTKKSYWDNGHERGASLTPSAHSIADDPYYAGLIPHEDAFAFFRRESDSANSISNVRHYVTGPPRDDVFGLRDEDSDATVGRENNRRRDRDVQSREDRFDRSVSREDEVEEDTVHREKDLYEADRDVRFGDPFRDHRYGLLDEGENELEDLGRVLRDDRGIGFCDNFFGRADLDQHEDEPQHVESDPRADRSYLRDDDFHLSYLGHNEDNDDLQAEPHEDRRVYLGDDGFRRSELDEDETAEGGRSREACKICIRAEDLGRSDMDEDEREDLRRHRDLIRKVRSRYDGSGRGESYRQPVNVGGDAHTGREVRSQDDAFGRGQSYRQPTNVSRSHYKERDIHSYDDALGRSGVEDDEPPYKKRRNAITEWMDRPEDSYSQY